MSVAAGQRLVVLHDHLDGGVRPFTLVELARQQGVTVPVSDPAQLSSWLVAARSGGLTGYLATFAPVLAVLQTRDALTRVVWEAVEDLAADGVIYAELRFAPELHLAAGLTLDEALETVTRAALEASAVHGLRVNIVVCAMRHASYSSEVARAAARFRDSLVVGLDLAGPERGWSAANHADAFAIARSASLGVTVHAGEDDGLASIRAALDACDATRLGHGIRIVDDIHRNDDGVFELGPVATAVHGRRVHLEVCPSSNLHTGAVRSLDAHPLGLLESLGFSVGVNADNRTISGVSASSEMHLAAGLFNWSDEVVRQVALNALNAAFVDDAERSTLARSLSIPT